jgi:SAM-dependent methyltransferase
MTLLQYYQERERKALSETYGGRGTYCVNRAWLATLAIPYINSYLEHGINPDILEIGCGNGRNLTKIIENHPSLNPSRIIGTSLDNMDGHDKVKKIGVRLKTGIVAEDLPVAWENSFDIVMASVVMQWTVLDRSIPEILKTIKHNGYFLGYDSRSDAAIIEEKSQECESVEILQGQPATIGDYVAFVIRKL